MGIRDFYKVFNSVAHRNTLQDALRNITTILEGRNVQNGRKLPRIGIDGSNVFYRALHTAGQTSCNFSNSSLENLVWYFWNDFLPRNCDIVIVCDGRKVPQETLVKCRSHTTSANNLATAATQKKKTFSSTFFINSPPLRSVLLRLREKPGVTVLQSPYEADAQLAYLYRIREIDAVIGEDSDLLVYGCGRLWRHYGRNSVTEYDLSNVLRHPKLPISPHSRSDVSTRQSTATLKVVQPSSPHVSRSAKDFLPKVPKLADLQFLSVLAGSDYSSPCPGIRLATAIVLCSNCTTLSDIFWVQYTGSSEESTTKLNISDESKAQRDLRSKFANDDYQTFVQNFENAMYVFRHHIVYCPVSRKLVSLSSAFDDDSFRRERRSNVVGDMYDAHTAVRVCEDLELNPVTLEPV